MAFPESRRQQRMHFCVEAARNGVVIEAGLRFGTREADDLEKRLRLLAPFEVIVVDLAGAREVDDGAVARLAQALQRLAPSVEFRGLSRHQRRLLRYLGQGRADAPEEAIAKGGSSTASP